MGGLSGYTNGGEHDGMWDGVCDDGEGGGKVE